MGFTSKVFHYVTHKKTEGTKESTHAPNTQRKSEGSLPEFLDEETGETPVHKDSDEENDGRHYQWRPRPLDDDFPLSG